MLCFFLTFVVALKTTAATISTSTGKAAAVCAPPPLWGCAFASGGQNIPGSRSLKRPSSLTSSFSRSSRSSSSSSSYRFDGGGGGGGLRGIPRLRGATAEAATRTGRSGKFRGSLSVFSDGEGYVEGGANSFRAENRRHRHHHHRRRRPREQRQRHDEATTATFLIPACVETRSFAARLMDGVILPSDEYGDRIRYGREAQGMKDDDPSTRVFRGDDPILHATYGEFPLESFDTLLDESLRHLPPKTTTDDDGAIVFTDVGSGCGRLCHYAALCRPNWSVHGIEISPPLHRRAVSAAASETADDDNNPFVPAPNDENIMMRRRGAGSSLSFHCGPAEMYGENVLRSSDVVFCYSTAFGNGGFDPECSGMLFDGEWDDLFTRYCKPGCIVITVDRVLRRSPGRWKLLRRIDDVPNPEVWRSTCFIQQRII